MNDYLLDLIYRYRSKGIIVDTNLLLLYIVGSIDYLLIRKFSRTDAYSEDDFYRVSKFVDAFERKVTTPHLLTQLTDLFGNRTDLAPGAATFISIATEIFTVSKKLCGSHFVEFGLADSAVIDAAATGYLVLTDDGPLFGLLTNSKFDAVNLAQIRTINLDS